MGDLQSYARTQYAPLSVGARFIRGFKRIGLVLSLIIFVGGAAISIFVAYDQQQSAERKFAQASCMNDRIRNNWPIKMLSYNQSKIDFDATGCPGGGFYYESLPVILSYAGHKPAPLEYAVEPFVYGTLLSFAAASMIFFACWTVGWLFAGFTRD